MNREMIRSFRDKEAERIFGEQRSQKLPPEIQRSALHKLIQLDNAVTLEDLRVPPGNRLEALRGDRAGQYRIQINQQGRACFVWRDGNAYEVEIVDYH